MEANERVVDDDDDVNEYALVVAVIEETAHMLGRCATDWAIVRQMEALVMLIIFEMFYATNLPFLLCCDAIKITTQIYNYKCSITQHEHRSLRTGMCTPENVWKQIWLIPK